MKKYICKINTVGKNIKSDQLKVIVDSCVKTYLQMNGKIMTANKAANMIKKSLGENWLVFISNNSYKDFDFCLSPGKKENYVCFVFCDKLRPFPAQIRHEIPRTSPTELLDLRPRQWLDRLRRQDRRRQRPGQLPPRQADRPLVPPRRRARFTRAAARS